MLDVICSIVQTPRDVSRVAWTFRSLHPRRLAPWTFHRPKTACRRRRKRTGGRQKRSRRRLGK